jgi:DNA-binding NarL/FixJ family response regulator
VLLADDHRLVAEGLKSLLSPVFDLVGVVEDGRALLEEAARRKPDVVVVDITMPRLNGLEAIPLLKKADPNVKIVVVTMHSEAAYARRALAAGAHGFVLKHAAPADLVAAIRAAVEGKIFVTPQVAGDDLRAQRAGRTAGGGDALTERQREILQLIVKGKTAKEIAALLGLSARTVEFHKYKMMETVGAESSAELIQFAIRRGIAGN